MHTNSGGSMQLLLLIQYHTDGYYQPDATSHWGCIAVDSATCWTKHIWLPTRTLSLCKPELGLLDVLRI
jgi:hypothetical protein